MRLREDSERVTVSLREAVTLLCKTGFTFNSQLHIDGLLGITLDDDQVHLVKIQEVIRVTNDASDDRSTDSASPVSQNASESANEEVIDLCVKSGTPMDQDTQGNNQSGAHNTDVNNDTVQNGDDLDDEDEQQLVINFDETDKHSQQNITQKDNNAAESSEINNSEQENKPKRRSRKGKATRHIIRTSVDDLSGMSDIDTSPYNLVTNNDSQEAASISAFADDSSCNSGVNGPVNLSNQMSPENYSVDDLIIKEEQNESQLNISDVSNHFNFSSANMLQSVTISAAPVPNVPYTDPELHAQWLQNIAQAVQNTQQNPLVIAPPVSQPAKSSIKKSGKEPIAIAPAPAANKDLATQLGMHRYSPYLVPPVMGPLANTVVLNTPTIGKIKGKPPNAVVNSTGNAVPIKSQQKNHGEVSPNSVFSCANCGITKTTTWRRNTNGEHVCNPCGLYFRMYKNASPRSGGRGGSNLNTSSSASPKSGNNSFSSNKNAAHICTNCGTLVTTMWRRNMEGEPVCNACGLYYKLHKVNRPLHMAKTEIHSRRRKPKSPTVNIPGFGGDNSPLLPVSSAGLTLVFGAGNPVLDLTSASPIHSADEAIPLITGGVVADNSTVAMDVGQQEIL